MGAGCGLRPLGLSVSKSGLVFEARRAHHERHEPYHESPAPFALSPSKGARVSWFDKLTTNGMSLTMSHPPRSP